MVQYKFYKNYGSIHVLSKSWFNTSFIKFMVQYKFFDKFMVHYKFC
jgi:hypothetical protein